MATHRFPTNSLRTASALGAVVLGFFAAQSSEWLVLAAAVGLMLTAIGWPAAGVAAIVVVRPLVDQAAVKLGLGTLYGQSPSALLGLAIVGASLVVILSHSRGRPISTWLHPWWLLAAYLLVRILAGGFDSYSVGIFGRVLSWVALCSAVCLLAENGLLSARFSRVATIAALVVAVSALAALGSSSRAFYGLGEATGYFYNPQGMSFPLVLLLPALLRGAGEGSAWGRLSSLAAVLSTVVIVLSLVRAAWIALVIVGLAGLVFGRSWSKLERRRLVRAAFVVVICVVLISVVRWDAIAVRLDNLIPSGDTASIGSGRGEIYSVVWNAFKSQGPLGLVFGAGLGATMSATGSALGASLVAHSDVLWILYETGLVGLLIAAWAAWRVLALLAAGASRSRGRPSWASLAFSATLGLLVLAALNGVLADGAMTYYAVILGLGLRSGATSEEATG